MSTVIEKWDEILGIVKKEHDLSDVRFDTWLKPLKVYDVSGNVVTIVASDQVRLSYINKNYKLPLQVTISEVTGMTDCEVKFILPEDVPAKKSISDAAPDQDNRFKAKSCTTIDKQRIVRISRRFRYCQGCSLSQFVVLPTIKVLNVYLGFRFASSHLALKRLS